ncbi:hypothetical protein BB559_004360 [Furculomyces boomerangus]|uniref:Kinesin-like protein n=1 Tax=Furculomyces boomerangus TaxID=61424 RepID=A0A2T9YF78_9FUNG|nr:hypothetical protein BB559_004360 [Furculomyces boomerangus]
MSVQSNNIKVIARFRPQNIKELEERGENAIQDIQGQSVIINSNEGNSSFTFDRTFGPETSQKELFDYSIKQTIEDIINGYNGTVFAYGQTGSGKTYTMMGSDIDDEEYKGIIPRIVEGIFTKIINSPKSIEYLVKVSYMEIYMERIRDLLNPVQDNLHVHEDKINGVHVKGLMEVFVSSIEEVYNTMTEGSKYRVTAQTNMNAESSRSHSIFQIVIQQKNTLDGKIKLGKLSLVDLAGSEKLGKTGATGQTLEEAKKINKSLSALGMVINALTDGKSTHIPYRDSKLTRILQESLGGNSRTTLIINCSPSSSNVSETISTLRFGTRAKRIKNRATINQEVSSEELKTMIKKLKTKVISYSSYIQMLEGELQVWRKGGSVDLESQADWNKHSKVSVILNDEKDDNKDRKITPTPAPTTPLFNRNSVTPTFKKRALSFTQKENASLGNNQNAYSLQFPKLDYKKNNFKFEPNSGRNSELASPVSPTFNESFINDLTLRSPTPSGMSEDEREEFLRRESELVEEISEKDQLLKEKEECIEELQRKLEMVHIELDDSRLDCETIKTENSKLKIDIEQQEIAVNEQKLLIDESEKSMTTGFGKTIKEKIVESRLAEKIEKKSYLSVSGNKLGYNESTTNDFEGFLNEAGKVKLMELKVQNLENDIGVSQLEIMRLSKLDQVNSERIETLQRENTDLSDLLNTNENKFQNLLTDYESYLDTNIDTDEEDDDIYQETNEGSTHSKGYYREYVKKTNLESVYSGLLDEKTKEIDFLSKSIASGNEKVEELLCTIKEYKETSDDLKDKILNIDISIQELLEIVEKFDSEKNEKDKDSGYDVGADDSRSAMILKRKLIEHEKKNEVLMKDLESEMKKVISLEVELDQSKSLINQLGKEVDVPVQAEIKKHETISNYLSKLSTEITKLSEQNKKLKRQINSKDIAISNKQQPTNFGYYNNPIYNSSYTAYSGMDQNKMSLYSRVAKPFRGGGGIN